MCSYWSSAGVPLLPPNEIGSLAGVLRSDTQIPEFLDKEAQTWVQDAIVTPQTIVAIATIPLVLWSSLFEAAQLY